MFWDYCQSLHGEDSQFLALKTMSRKFLSILTFRVLSIAWSLTSLMQEIMSMESLTW